DGLNVVNGEMTAMQNDEPMYVLDPYESATIQGWRTSLQNVRQFVFVDEQHSYAERTDQANSDMGWIRVLAFRERRLAWRPRYRDDDQVGRPELRDAPQAQVPETGDKAQPAPVTPGAGESMVAPSEPNAQQFPGTGWGERRRDPVRRVEFHAEAQPTDHLVLRYEYADGLRALGIILRTRGSRLWERDGQVGFAEPPRW